MSKNFFFSISFLFLMTGCGQIPVEEDTKDTTVPVAEEKLFTKKIIAFGDSLTEGYGLPKNESYPSALQKKLEAEGFEQYEVVNAGVSGETSTGALGRVDFIITQAPDIVILEIGANDALRGIDLDLTKQNIDEIITRLKSTSRKKIEVVLAGMQMTENLGQEYVTKFESIYPDLAQKHNILFIPSFLEGVGGDPNLNISDGIHPTTEGYAIIVKKNVWPVLKTIL